MPELDHHRFGSVSLRVALEMSLVIVPQSMAE